MFLRAQDVTGDSSWSPTVASGSHSTPSPPTEPTRAEHATASGGAAHVAAGAQGRALHPIRAGGFSVASAAAEPPPPSPSSGLTGAWLPSDQSVSVSPAGAAPASLSPAAKRASPSFSAAAAA